MVQSVDLAILRMVYAGQMPSPFIDAILLLTFLGSGWMLLGLCPAFFMQRWRAPAMALLAALTTLSGLVAVVKAMTCRVRPCHAVTWARGGSFAVPSDNSFPSGHAAGSFAFASFIMSMNPQAGVWLMAVASAIALSRVALGVHYPSDVVAGAILGSSFGWVAGRLYTRRSRLSPVGRLADADSEPARE
jgi:undecaprenyl-diphosphatase